jgi:hypothetical protein
MLWFEMYMNYWVPFFLGEFLSGHLVTHTVVISSSVNLDRTYCAPVCSRPWDSYQRFFTIQDSSRYINKKSSLNWLWLNTLAFENFIQERQRHHFIIWPLKPITWKMLRFPLYVLLLVHQVVFTLWVRVLSCSRKCGHGTWFLMSHLHHQEDTVWGLLWLHVKNKTRWNINKKDSVKYTDWPSLY